MHEYHVWRNGGGDVNVRLMLTLAKLYVHTNETYCQWENNHYEGLMLMIVTNTTCVM